MVVPIDYQTNADQHLADGVKQADVSAVPVGSLFHFTDARRSRG